MEVHAHSHSARKKWTHYFWEFLMLFLAVFCGFLAENIREHKVEHNRAKEYARGLITDLGIDTLQLHQLIEQNKKVLTSMDSVSSIVHSGIVDNKVRGSFYLYSQLGCFSPTVVWSNASLIQLIQSGNLRYFRNIELVDKISTYYARQDYVRQLNNTDKERRDKTLEIRNRVLKNYYFKGFSSILPSDTIKISESMVNNLLQLESSDIHLLNEYANSFETRIALINLVIKDTYPKAMLKAQELISLLKKEYHLK